MSRSYRKPYWTEAYGGKWRRFAKRQASKRFRKTKIIADFRFYNSVYDSWSVCDFKFLDPDSAPDNWKAKSK